MSAAEKVQNPLLDKNFLNAFVDGVIKTMSLMASTVVKPQKPLIQNKFEPKGEIAGMVGMVAGPMKGTLTISYTRPAIFKILENMLGEKYTDLTTEVTDAVGELTNQIYGSAKTTLNQMGYQFEMAIPTVIQGQFHISQYHSGTTLVVPFLVDECSTPFFVEITVQA
ncbi:MAG: chemotaxis protein CheX [Bdellovibrionaceae bacterium]|jgi:chemotaxis protein CheX|nr:chemotaxis protein CheX [Pseudobdellovibrionaceae bacterium]